MYFNNKGYMHCGLFKYVSEAKYTRLLLRACFRMNTSTLHAWRACNCNNTQTILVSSSAAWLCADQMMSLAKNFVCKCYLREAYRDCAR